MLHLRAVKWMILAGTPLSRAQLRLPHLARQGAIGDRHALLGEQLPRAHGIATRLAEHLGNPRGARIGPRRDSGFAARLLRWATQYPAHRVARQMQQAADLTQGVALRPQHVHARTDLGWYHA